MPAKVINDELLEGFNEFKSYPCIWGGYEVDIDLGDKHIQLKTDLGIRTPFCHAVLYHMDGEWRVQPEYTIGKVTKMLNEKQELIAKNFVELQDLVRDVVEEVRQDNKFADINIVVWLDDIDLSFDYNDTTGAIGMYLAAIGEGNSWVKIDVRASEYDGKDKIKTVIEYVRK